MASGVLKLPWRPAIAPWAGNPNPSPDPDPNPDPSPSPSPNPNPAIASWAGNITYTLDPQTGLVAAQTDVWNITRLDAIRQSFTPGPRTE